MCFSQITEVTFGHNKMQNNFLGENLFYFQKNINPILSTGNKIIKQLSISLVHSFSLESLGNEFIHICH